MHGIIYRKGLGMRLRELTCDPVDDDALVDPGGPAHPHGQQQEEDPEAPDARGTAAGLPLAELRAEVLILREEKPHGTAQAVQLNTSC